MKDWVAAFLAATLLVGVVIWCVKIFIQILV